MSLVTLPRSGMPLAGSLTISREWYRWARDITERVGGVNGASTQDLVASQFDDAGLEEVKFSVYRLADELGSLPPQVVAQIEHLTTEVSELRETLAVVTQRLQDLQQGIAP